MSMANFSRSCELPLPICVSTTGRWTGWPVCWNPPRAARTAAPSPLWPGASVPRCPRCRSSSTVSSPPATSTNATVATPWGLRRGCSRRERGNHPSRRSRTRRSTSWPGTPACPCSSPPGSATTPSTSTGPAPTRASTSRCPPGSARRCPTPRPAGSCSPTSPRPSASGWRWPRTTVTPAPPPRCSTPARGSAPTGSNAARAAPCCPGRSPSRSHSATTAGSRGALSAADRGSGPLPRGVADALADAADAWST